MATVTNTDLHLAKPVPPVNKADAARDAVDEIFAEMGSVTKRPHPNSAVRTVRSRPACERGTRFQLEPRTSQRRREPQEPIHVHQVVRGLCVAPMLVGLTMLAMPALFSYSWSPLRDTEVGKSATSMMRTSNNVQTTPIQDMRVGERTAGTNPICEQVAGLTPNPETWRKLDLFMTKESGLGLWIELLRPLEWIEAVGAAEGETVYLDLAEFGAEGKANVTYLGPCPPVQPGNGPIVTGTFKHQADENTEVVDLRLDGQKEPTGVTSNHPYWSVDRQSFVEVGKLRQGEQVDTLEGTRRVVSITPIKYTDFLYNMETTEHVYRVGSLGTLVHNTCILDFVCLKRARQLADNIDANRIFKLTDDELDLVGHIRNKKPNLQVFRTNQRDKLGDFLLIDRSNASKPMAFLVDLKSGGGGAGSQLSNWKAVASVFDDIDEGLIFRFSGTADELMEVLSRGRAAFPQ